MAEDGSASQNPLVSTFYVSTVVISLARDSGKKIESIKLRKNDNSVKEIRKAIPPGGTHKEEFNPPLPLGPDDHIFVSVSCASKLRRMDISIDVNLRDVECRRDGQGTRMYRKKTRNVEVLVAGQTDQAVQAGQTGHHSLLATTTPIIQSCSQFRLLIIGNSGVGKSSLIHKVFGVEKVHTSDTIRGYADINQEFVSPTNKRFVVHDSLGFEAGDEQNMDLVKQFVERRKKMSQIKDQLHAIWLCLEVPHAGGRLLEAGVEKFLQHREEILGNVPLVVVLTKVDQLDIQLEFDLPEGVLLQEHRFKYMNEHCIVPLRNAAGKDITHVTVSVQDGYSESLSALVKATDENMAKYHVDEAPRAVAIIAQRISIKEKLELSIAVGKKKYWRMLLKSAVFRGHTLEECLKVIQKDIITVWNFDDPDKCLMNDTIIKALLASDHPEDSNANDTSSNLASFGGLLASGVELLKGLSGSGDPVLSVAVPVAGIVITVLQTTYEAYKEAKKDVKILMAFIVDLICVMQAIFLLASGHHVTSQTVMLALQAYEKQRWFVHLVVSDFDSKLGVLPGGCDYVLEKIEELIWRYSIPDHEIDELRRRISHVLLLKS